MVTILQHHTVVRDGWHNMLTDLVYWREYYWLVYCQRTSHYSLDGENVVLRSVDLKRWQEVVRFKTVGDDREPKFCLADDRLFVYFGTFLPPHYLTGKGHKRSIVTYASVTDDGIKWSKPEPVWKDQWLWRVRYHSGAFFGAAYGFGPTGEIRDHMHGPLDLLTSQNGLEWKKVSTITGVEDRPNEADLTFRSDGELWLIVCTWRGQGFSNNHTLFFSATPPYREWKRIDLKKTIYCPCFCETGEKLYVAGMRSLEEPWIPQSIPAGSTAIWTVEKGSVTPFFSLPSYGDVAYPGLFARESGKLVVSYSSQHAYLSGVLSSKMPLPASGQRPERFTSDEDIFVAEIATD